MASLFEISEYRPSPDDVPALPYTQAVVNETLRLYPPAYVTGPEAIRAERSSRSSGSRKCIGLAFAMMEGTLLPRDDRPSLALEWSPGEIGTHPSITLRPKAAMPGRMRGVA